MLTTLGFVVLHFAPARIHANAAAVCAEVRSTLAANRSLPWPPSVLMIGS